MIEQCKLCDQESTPWFHFKGHHLCQDCYLDLSGNKWISVKEQLPKDDKEWSLLSNGERIWIGQMDWNNKDFYCKCCLENLNGVVYWQPLPEPPENKHD